MVDMATRTSLYSFQNNIIEIAISIDAISELHGANEPLTKAEKIKFGLLEGSNPWRHLGVPDFVLEKPEEETESESKQTIVWILYFILSFFVMIGMMRNDIV